MLINFLLKVGNSRLRHVSDEQSLSDDKQIFFKVDAVGTILIPIRIQKKTEWRHYTSLIKDSKHDIESFNLFNNLEFLDEVAR
jgi:hypothetical protein